MQLVKTEIIESTAPLQQPHKRGTFFFGTSYRNQGRTEKVAIAYKLTKTLRDVNTKRLFAISYTVKCGAWKKIIFYKKLQYESSKT